MLHNFENSIIFARERKTLDGTGNVVVNTSRLLIIMPPTAEAYAVVDEILRPKSIEYRVDNTSKALCLPASRRSK